MIERAAIGALNYLLAIHWAAQTMWIADHTEHAAVVERNLQTKILEPDFSCAESDGRWDAAVLCALTGRPDEARTWFQQAHDRLTAQEAILLLPHVCYDEALMEARLGPTGDRANGLRRLDEARTWIAHIGLPKLLPRIDALTARLSN